MDGLDELIGHTLVVTLLHGLHHISSLLTRAIHDQVITLLYTLPTLVAVHGVETTHDTCDSSIIRSADVAHLLDEALTALGVGITTVHIAMYEHLILQTISLTDLDQLEQMVEAGVHTTV